MTKDVVIKSGRGFTCISLVTPLLKILGTGLSSYGAAVVNLQAMEEETCRLVDSYLPEKALLMSKRNSLVLFLEWNLLYVRKSFVKNKNKNKKNKSRFCQFLVPYLEQKVSLTPFRPLQLR